MSSYHVLARVSALLGDMLWDAYRIDNQINPQVVSSRNAIVLSNPTETKQQAANKLSLWLFQINENPYLKNQNLLRTRVPNAVRPEPMAYPPLSLDLCYLVTPFTGAADADLNLLGKTMQVFYDRSIVKVEEPNDEVFEELRIVLTNMDLEEITRVWEALNEPYRLSVCYKVRVTSITSDRRLELGRVDEQTRQYRDDPA